MGDWTGHGFANEAPVHAVTLDSYALGRTPVTQGQWQQVMGNNPAHFARGADYPVEQVNWEDIQEFLRRLNNLTDGGYRLPSEAEWEYAARDGGLPQRWAGTDDEARVGEYGWYDENATMTTHPVAEKLPNTLGFHDMSGNVWEMVADVYAEDGYHHHTPRNPLHAGPGVDRVLRGGSWYSYRLLLRCTDRTIHGPHYRDRYVGFRVARTL